MTDMTPEELKEALELARALLSDNPVAAPVFTMAESIPSAEILARALLYYTTARPIAEAPKDGTEILTYKDIATVPVMHIARYVYADEWCPEREDGVNGWWSYTRTSVSQELLDGYRHPTHFYPLPPEPEE